MKFIRPIPKSTLDVFAKGLADHVADLTGAKLERALREFEDEPRQPVQQAQPLPGELLTLVEAAARLKVCRKTLYNMIERGDLPKVKIGAATRIPAAAIVALASGEA